MIFSALTMSIVRIVFSCVSIGVDRITNIINEQVAAITTTYVSTH